MSTPLAGAIRGESQHRPVERSQTLSRAVSNDCLSGVDLALAVIDGLIGAVCSTPPLI
jgi:hypothetical protein